MSNTILFKNCSNSVLTKEGPLSVATMSGNWENKFLKCSIVLGDHDVDACIVSPSIHFDPASTTNKNM